MSSHVQIIVLFVVMDYLLILGKWLAQLLGLSITLKRIVVINGRIYVINGRIYVINGRIYVINGRIYVINGRIYVINGRIYVINGRIYVINGGTCVINGGTCVINGGTCVINGGTCVINAGCNDQYSGKTVHLGNSGKEHFHTVSGQFPSRTVPIPDSSHPGQFPSHKSISIGSLLFY